MNFLPPWRMCHPWPTRSDNTPPPPPPTTTTTTITN